MPFLYDGYNIYHAALKAGGDGPTLVPMTLCKMLAADLMLLRDSGEVVFDGSERKGEFLNLEEDSPLRVTYAGGGKDADSLIIRRIKANTAPRRLVVVSSDREILRAARRRRAKTQTSMEYLEDLIRRATRPERMRVEPLEKWVGLSDGDLPGWLHFFNIKPKRSDGDDEDDMLDLIRF